MNNLFANSQKLLQVWRKFKPISFVRSCSIDTHENEGTLGDPRVVQSNEKCVNEVKLIGRVGGGVSMRTSKNGKPIIRFVVATSFTFTPGDSSDGPRVVTAWHHIAAFDINLINQVESSIKKGQRVYISGRLAYMSPDRVPFIALREIVCLD